MLLTISACRGRSSLCWASQQLVHRNWMLRVDMDFKNVHHFSHFILGGDPAMSQYAGIPTGPDGLLEVAPPLFSDVSRSAMVTTDKDYYDIE